MDFERSSQARSWLFDSSTLLQCREKALTDKPKGSSSLRVRRFASGFHRRHAGTAENVDPPHTNRQVSSSSALAVEEQEMLVRFHAMQITQLIGPMAILNGLVRNSAILATAVMLFRRFYMSNSVLDYEPRRIAVAAAYLASKVGEQRVELSLLERATELIERKLVGSSLGEQESYHVTVKEIETSERELMEGINYEMQCHHPYTAIRVLAKEMALFLSDYEEERDHCDTIQTASPRHVHDFDEVERQRNLFEDAIAVAQNALLFSDVPFLFSPGPIAFASIAIASRNGRKPPPKVEGHSSPLEPQVREFLRVRFPAEQEYDLRDFESQVGKICVSMIDNTVIDSNMLASCQSEEPEGYDDVTIQIFELRRVSCKVAALRLSRQAVRSRHGRYQSPRKRKGDDEEVLSVNNRVEIGKIPKVTPTRL